jgi:hypothetical protein
MAAMKPGGEKMGGCCSKTKKVEAKKETKDTKKGKCCK